MTDWEKKFRKHGESLVLKFESAEAADHFKSWLCESGEQHYWEWMQMREQEEEGDITGLKFNYHTGTDLIPVKCGRFSEYKDFPDE